MKQYSYEEIEKELGYEFEKKHTECDVLKLFKLRKMLEEGWVIFDTQVTDQPDMKILTLVKVQ